MQTWPPTLVIAWSSAIFAKFSQRCESASIAGMHSCINEVKEGRFERSTAPLHLSDPTVAFDKP